MSHRVEMEARRYPPAPWRLCGSSVQAVRLVPTRAARALVPKSMHIVPVAPGKTIGVLYCARYGAGSTLAYHELIVAPALVYAHGRVGWWISHIYVDDLAALEGGRVIWGLPKKLASFHWSRAPASVQVSYRAERLCHIEWQPARAGWRLPGFLPVLSSIDGQTMFFRASGTCTLSRCTAEIDVNASSGFEMLGFGRAKHLWSGDNLRLDVTPPSSLR